MLRRQTDRQRCLQDERRRARCEQCGNTNYSEQCSVQQQKWKAAQVERRLKQDAKCELLRASAQARLTRSGKRLEYCASDENRKPVDSTQLGALPPNRSEGGAIASASGMVWNRRAWSTARCGEDAIEWSEVEMVWSRSQSHGDMSKCGVRFLNSALLGCDSIIVLRHSIAPGARRGERGPRATTSRTRCSTGRDGAAWLDATRLAAARAQPHPVLTRASNGQHSYYEMSEGMLLAC